MAYTTINKSTDYFDTKIHNGNGTAKTLAYDFEVDMYWTKMRNDAYPQNLFDAVRGNNNRIRPNKTNAGAVIGNAVSFGNSSGISLGTDSGNYGINKTTTDGGAQATYVGWGWKANGAGSANTDGDINSTVSVNTTAGFSIVKFTGTGANATVGHGLGVAPSMIFFKNLDRSVNWIVYNKNIGATKFLYLNATDAQGTDTGHFNNTEPTSSLFTVGTANGTNYSGENIIAYCFAEKQGYSKFGSYIANSDTTAKPNNDATFIYTGFKPKFIMAKRTDGTSDWSIFDTERSIYNPMYNILFPNTSAVENTSEPIDVYSNGWKPRADSGIFNYPAGSNWIYYAVGQSLVGSNNVPCTAR